MNNELKIEISKRVFNDIYLPYLDNEDRYLVIYGGASSGKSYFIAQRYLYRSFKGNINLLVVRQTGDSNRQSTFALFKQVLSNWKLSQYFKINESDMKITNRLNGNEIIFKGLDDVEKLKSLTFTNGELTDIWVEEASETQEADINQLNIRLRGGKSKKQMVISFNPIDINHWIKKKFINSGLATVVHSTYKHNKFLTEDDAKVLEAFKDTDPYYYQVYCLGQWGVLGNTIFDANKVNERLSVIKKPILTGYFAYDYDGLAITNIRFVAENNGYINIYEQPKETKYAIGGDTSGEGSDYFTGQVLDVAGKQVATLKHQMDEDLYAKQLYCLGKYYKYALIGIEANFSTYPIKELERLGYKNMYIREREDTYTGSIVKSYGFRTTSTTRPIIISNLVQIVRENIEQFNDRETLEEMLTFVRSEKGKPEAQKGAHDDLIMGIAIAHYIKDQISYSLSPSEQDLREHYKYEQEIQELAGSDYSDLLSF